MKINKSNILNVGVCCAVFLLLVGFSTQAIAEQATAQEVFTAEITSATPSDLPSGKSSTVSVYIRSSNGSGNVFIEADSWPTGWSVSPKNFNPTITQGTTYKYDFTVTTPTGTSSGTIVWKLYDDDWGTHPNGSKLLYTRNQSVSATPPSYTVAATAGTGGTVTPSSRTVKQGDTTTFTVSPSTGYERDSVSGDASGGSWNGNTYTTAPVTQARTLNFTFKKKTYTVSATAGTGGSVTPSSRTVLHGDTTTFTVSPSTGYERDSVSGDASGGSWNGNTYTTAPVTQARTLNFTFKKKTYTVSATAGTGGSVTPSSRNVSHGDTTTFTVSPSTGYERDSVSGDASGGSWSGNTYTTAPVTQARSLTFSFKGYPDLVVTNVWVEPASPTEGQTFVIKASVKNQGVATASAGLFADIECFMYVDGAKIGEGNFDDLAPGNSITVSSGNLTAPVAGPHTPKAKADGNSEITESNESNNEFTGSNFTVNPPPRADLIVTAVWTEPATPTEGQNYVVKATVKNQGNATASAGLIADIECFMYVDGAKIGEGNFDDLAPGNSITVSSGNLTAPVAGPHTPKAKADGNSEITESNENNNELTGSSFTVNPPPSPKPDLVSVTGVPSSTGVGQSFTVTVRAENDGYQSPEGSIHVVARYSDNTDDLLMDNASASWANPLLVKGPGTATIYTRTGGTKTNTDWFTEAAQNPWPGVTSHDLSIRVTPNKTGTLKILVRTTMQRTVNSATDWINDISADTGNPQENDEQGWECRVYTVNVVVAQPDLVSVTGVPSSTGVGQSFTVTVRAENDGYQSPEGSIHVVARYSDNTDDLLMDNASASWANPLLVKGPGTATIYTRTGGTKTNTDWFTEAAQNPWPGVTSHDLSIRVTPNKTGTLKILVRTTMQRTVNSATDWINDISADTGNPQENDEQGWECRVYTVNVVVAQPDLVSVTGVPSSTGVGQSFTVTVRAENDGYQSPEGSIHVVARYSDNTDDLLMDNASASWANPLLVKGPGTATIYTRTGGTKTNTDWFTEAVQNPWPGVTSHDLSVRVTPNKTGTLRILVRTTMQRTVASATDWINDISADTGNPQENDEQGWECRVYTVNVQNQFPVITLFSINNGAASTNSRTVILNNTCTNSPTHYMASENSNFSGASWQTYSTSPQFTLSSANGTKKVYFKVKNSFGEDSDFDTITLSVVQGAVLKGLITRKDSQNTVLGSLAGATVLLDNGKSTTSNAQGEYEFTGLDAGSVTVTASKTGYYPVTRTITLAANETKSEILSLMSQSTIVPMAYDISSPNGNHFIEGMPGNLTFNARIAWNGTPGFVYFNIAGTQYAANIIDLGNGQASASLTISAPEVIDTCAELSIDVVNGSGESTSRNTGIHFYSVPGIIVPWYSDNIPWNPSGLKLTYKEDFGWGGALTMPFISFKYFTGDMQQLEYDMLSGTFSGSRGGFGTFGLGFNDPSGTSIYEVSGEGRIEKSGTLKVVLAGCGTPVMTPGWSFAFSGKAGIGAPAVKMLDIVAPGLGESLSHVPVAKNLKLKLFVFGTGRISGQYEKDKVSQCYLGATSINNSVTFGVEGQAVLNNQRGTIGAGVYVGGSGTPEFQVCPEFEFQAITLRAYVGVFAWAPLFYYKEEVGTEIRFDNGQQANLLGIAAISDISNSSNYSGMWQPIGQDLSRWGTANRSVSVEQPLMLKAESLSETNVPVEKKVLENVTKLTSPSLLVDASKTRIFFSLYDLNKPWYAATDIACTQSATDGSWPVNRIADDNVADFSPDVLKINSNKTLATWERVSGDVSTATDPEQIAPHLEVTTSWFDQNSQTWSTPIQITNNNQVDRNPMPVMFGTTTGILWIENDADSSIGNTTHGDKLMFTSWSGTQWNAPQTLWSAAKGILSISFAEDNNGQGYVIFAVDEDGDSNTRADRELYRASTVAGTWQTATRITNDTVEDSIPVLVKPEETPILVWDSNSLLYYTPLNNWNPKEVYSEHTLSNQAATLDGVALPGGAAIAYTVQGESGVDIVASFYDAYLDQWSLPRQLTHDEHAESSLSLASGNSGLAIAYLKTITERNSIDIEINGVIQHLENVPQPARTDLYVLNYALGDDIAVDSIAVTPSNPAPGQQATITATIENKGDLPLEDVNIQFYDGDPANGGNVIATQAITGTLIAGAKQDVSVSWDVSGDDDSHQLFVIADPNLELDDRDRSNNVSSLQVVLPELSVEQCWSTIVSGDSVALTARIINTGTITAGAFDISWRIGAVNGIEIGKSTITSLSAGTAHEVIYIMDNPCLCQGSLVYAVVDSGNVIPEVQEENNSKAMTIVMPGVCISASMELSSPWMYQNLSNSTKSKITITAKEISDTLDNSSYTYDWEVILPQDVSVAPTIVSGGGASDNFITLAAPPCSIGSGLSNAALPHKVKLTITGNQHGNTGVQESEIYVCLMGDVDNNGVVNLKDRQKCNDFWQGNPVPLTIQDCDVNCDGVVNLKDRQIVNDIWQGVLCQNYVGTPCPVR